MTSDFWSGTQDVEKKKEGVKEMIGKRFKTRKCPSDCFPERVVSQLSFLSPHFSFQFGGIRCFILV